METAATRQAPWSYPTILGEAMETSASFEARSAPLPYPTSKRHPTSGHRPAAPCRERVQDTLRWRRRRLSGQMKRPLPDRHELVARPPHAPRGTTLAVRSCGLSGSPADRLSRHLRLHQLAGPWCELLSGGIRAPREGGKFERVPLPVRGADAG